MTRPLCEVCGLPLHDDPSYSDDTKLCLTVGGRQHSPEDILEVLRATRRERDEARAELLEMDALRARLASLPVAELGFEEVKFLALIANGSWIKPITGPPWFATYPRGEPRDFVGGFPPAGDPRRRAGSGPLPEQAAPAPEQKPEDKSTSDLTRRLLEILDRDEKVPRGAALEDVFGDKLEEIRAVLATVTPSDLGEPGELATPEDLQKNKDEVNRGSR